MNCKRTIAALIALCTIEICAAQQQAALPDVTIAPKSSAAVSAHIIDQAKEPKISQAEKLRLIRSKIKYVFVLFQENRSFDFYFGSYPGADGLYSFSNLALSQGSLYGTTKYGGSNGSGVVFKITP